LQESGSETRSAEAQMTISDSRVRSRVGSFARGLSLVALAICASARASILAIAALVSMPSIALAQTKLASTGDGSQAARASATDSIERVLAARGLLGNNLATSAATIEPPSGTEVDETVQTAKQDGKTISRTRSWTERLDNDALHVELTRFPTSQSQVAFWVLPNDSGGCLMFGRTMYDRNGRPLQSEFWRNDRQLRITGAADFPTDLYPEALPAVALLRVIDFAHQDVLGKIDQQVSPYGFVDQQVTIKDSAPIEVPAGRFAAVRVDSAPNASSILPSWPSFTLGVVSRFLPQTTYFFQADPPHRLLRKEQAGTPFIGGPEATTELVRYYVAGVTARNWSTSQHEAGHSPG
jgi:hypothetical protein